MLFSTWFYGSPIELEDVGNHDFLGFVVSRPSDRTIQIIPMKGQWQVRHPESAGSPQVLLSGLRSRICQASRYGWPPESRHDQVQQIKQFHC